MGVVTPVTGLRVVFRLFIIIAIIAIIIVVNVVVVVVVVVVIVNVDVVVVIVVVIIVTIIANTIIARGGSGGLVGGGTLDSNQVLVWVRHDIRCALLICMTEDSMHVGTKCQLCTEPSAKGVQVSLLLDDSEQRVTSCALR